MTKMLTQSSIAALATIFAVSAPAQASDILTDPSTAYVQGNNAPARVNWSGFYIGGRVGYGNANHDLTIERYNGAYCFDAHGTRDPVAPEDPTNPTKEYFKKDGWVLVGPEGDVSNVPEEGCDVGTEQSPGQEVTVDPSSRNVANIDGVNSHGLIGGAQVGYDQQLGSRWLLGVFGSYDLSQIETSNDGFLRAVRNPDHALDVTGIEKGDEWSIGLRAGKLVTPETLLYILAAYTQTDYKFSGTDGEDTFSKTTDFSGVSVGGGVEFALTGNVFMGLEYTHTFYDDEEVLNTGASEVGGFGSRLVDSLDEDKVMATIKLKLNSDVFGN